MARGSEEDQLGFAAGNARFDPALLAVERLVGEDLEAELFGVEIDSVVLVADGNANKLNSFDDGRRTVALSYQEIAEATGLSKTAVQKAVKLLKRRRLIQVVLKNATATPVYRAVRPWAGRRSG